MLSCLIRVFQKRSFFLLSFSGVRRTLSNGTERMDGGCVHCLPASAKGEREEKGRGSTAFACTLARPLASTPVEGRYRRWLARLRTPSPSPLPVCLAFSLRPPHLPPFLLCTCVSAPGVCGRSRGRTDDVEAAITPVRVSERSFSIFLRIAPRATSRTILR